jgi:uncharacterized membrane protein
MLLAIKGKYLAHRWEITLLLLISSIYATGLELLRVYLSGHNNYLYFIWNLFLAWIPYLLSMYLPVSFYVIRVRAIAYLLLLVWFLFWPNSPYIITDLLHLKEKQNIPLWFDLGLILSFAWAGLMLGFISLIEIQNLIRKRTNRTVAWIFAVVTILNGSLGIYIGRYVRLNSWDIAADPVRVYTDIFQHLNDRMLRTEMIVMTLQYGIFLFLCYLTVKIIIKIPDRMAL